MSARRSLLCGLLALSALAGCAGADPAPRARPSARAPASARVPGGPLSDDDTRALVESFEVAMVRDGGDPQGPLTSALADKKMGELNAVCLRGARSSEVQSLLVSLLAKLQDPRAMPCFVDTLAHYRPDHSDDDVAQVVVSAERMKLVALAPHVMALFEKVRVHRHQQSGLGSVLSDAVLTFAASQDEPELIRHITARMPATDDPTFPDEYFWQTVSVRALGRLRSANAVQGLIAVLLDSDKVALASLASGALVQIGRPSIQPVASLIGASERELRERGAGTQRIGSLNVAGITASAIRLLGEIGADECAAALLAARSKVQPVNKIGIARALTQLPRKPENIKAFQELFEEAPSYVYPERVFGKQELALQAARFHDAKLTPWLVKQGLTVKDEYPSQSVKGAALLSAITLMTSEQVPDVRRLLKMRTPDGVVGDPYQQQWQTAVDLLASCERRTSCYLEALSQPVEPSKTSNFRQLKAAAMIGVLGDARARDELVAALPNVVLVARAAAIDAIVSLSPQGGAAAAEAVRPFGVEAAARLRAREP